MTTTIDRADPILVAGAGGFIGHHLVTYLKERGYWVRGVDLVEPEYRPTDADEFLLLDLRRWENCLVATEGVDEVYALAADMGGMGFISSHHAQILHNNTLINMHTIDAEEQLRKYGASSKTYTSPGFLKELFELGRRSATDWLERNIHYVGHASSVRIAERFL